MICIEGNQGHLWNPQWKGVEELLLANDKSHEWLDFRGDLISNSIKIRDMEDALVWKDKFVGVYIVGLDYKT